MKHMVLMLIMAVLFGSLSAAENSDSTAKIMSWNEAMEWVKETTPEERKKGYAVYVGRESNRVTQYIRNGVVDMKGIPLVILSAQEKVMNPITDTKIDPLQLIRLFASTIQANPAGSLIFCDAEGIPLPLLTVHHSLHRMEPKRLNLMLGYAASGMADQMSLDEYARIVGEGDLILQMAREIRTGELGDPSMLVMQHYAKQLQTDESLIAQSPDGSTIHTGKTTGTIYVVTSDPTGPAFIAQVNEIWHKLTVESHGTPERPPITVIGPANADWSALQTLGIRFKVGVAPMSILKAGSSPRTLLSGGEGGVVVELSGFIPGDLLSSLVGVQPADLRPLTPDMPLGEKDN